VEVLSERVDPVRDGGKPLIGQGFQFDRAEVLDLELVFAAPVNKGGLGDIKLGSDLGEGPPLRAEFDKPLDSFFVVHLCSFFGSTFSLSPIVRWWPRVS
jgi:hypothetical protein